MSHISEEADSHKDGNGLIPSNTWGDDTPVCSELVEKNLSIIKNNIAPYTPNIIGVTKYFGPDSIVSGYKAGLRNFGESRAQDAVKKIEQLPVEVRDNSVFHFIGHLQTNKVDEVVKYFDYIHSVDSFKVAAAISKAAVRLNKKEKLLLQLNNAHETQKFGYDKQELEEDLPKILMLENIEVLGLMNMAPLGAEETLLDKLFEDLKLYRDYLQTKFKISLPELSMGMSDDYIVAVRHGATMIRVGRKLFK